MVAHSREIELFSRLGIALMLFVGGHKIDLHIIRTMGPMTQATGLGQVVSALVVGCLIAIILARPPWQEQFS